MAHEVDEALKLLAVTPDNSDSLLLGTSPIQPSQPSITRSGGQRAVSKPLHHLPPSLINGTVGITIALELHLSRHNTQLYARPQTSANPRREEQPCTTLGIQT